MKLHDVRKLTSLGRAYTEEDMKRLYRDLQAQGIDLFGLYQELEMSSPFVNTHRDTSFSVSQVSLHSHAYIEVLYCRSDCGVEYLVGSDRYRLRQGDVVIVLPGVSHRPIFPEHMKEPYVRDVLWVSSTFMNSLRELFPADESVSLEWTFPIRTAGTRWEFLGDLFQRGVEEEAQKRPGWEAAVMGNSLLILANLKRAILERSAGPMKAEKPELLDRIMAYIEQNYTAHITVGDLAKTFYVSDSTVSHLFKQRMGVSVYRYVTQRRLIAAKALIHSGKLLEDVGREVGFRDYSTFYRAFKQEYGISPRQFSRKLS